MSVKTGSISLSTHGNIDIQDITRDVTRLVEQSDLRSGTVTVFCPSSTSGLTTVEFEQTKEKAGAQLTRLVEAMRV